MKKRDREAKILGNPAMFTRKDVLSKDLLTTKTSSIQRASEVADFVDKLPLRSSGIPLSESDKALKEVLDKPLEAELSIEDRSTIVSHMTDEEVTLRLKEFFVNSEREDVSVEEEIDYWKARAQARKPGENTLFCSEDRYVAWLEFHDEPFYGDRFRARPKKFWPITVRDKVVSIGGETRLIHRPFCKEDGVEAFSMALDRLKERRKVAIESVQSQKYLLAAVNAGFGPYRGYKLPFVGEVRSEPGYLEEYTSQGRYEDVMREFLTNLNVAYRASDRKVIVDFCKALEKPLARTEDAVKSHIATSYADVTDHDWYMEQLKKNATPCGAVMLLDSNNVPYRVILESIETPAESMFAWSRALNNAVNFGAVNSHIFSSASWEVHQSPKLETPIDDNGTGLPVVKPSVTATPTETLPAESGSFENGVGQVRLANKATHTELYNAKQVEILCGKASADRLALVQKDDDAYQSLLRNFESFYNYLPQPILSESVEEYNKRLDSWFNSQDVRFKTFKYNYPPESRVLLDKFMAEKVLISGSCRRGARQGGRIDQSVSMKISIGGKGGSPGQQHRSIDGKPSTSTGNVVMFSNTKHPEIDKVNSIAKKIVAKTLESQSLDPYNRLVGQLYQEMYRSVANALSVTGVPDPVYIYKDMITVDGAPRAMMRVVNDYKVTEQGLWLPTQADKNSLAKDYNEFGFWKRCMDMAKNTANALVASKGEKLPIQLVVRVEQPNGEVFIVPVTLPPDLIALIELGKKHQT